MTFAFDSLEAFFAMGKHGFYVWLAYGVGFAVILINILLARRQRSQAFEQVRRVIRLEAAPVSGAAHPVHESGPDAATVGSGQS